MKSFHTLSGWHILSYTTPCQTARTNGPFRDRSATKRSLRVTLTLRSEGPDGAVDDTRVRLVEPSGLYHFILVLHKQFHALDGGGRSLRDDGSCSGQQEVLRKPELLLTRHLKVPDGVLFWVFRHYLVEKFT